MQKEAIVKDIRYFPGLSNRPMRPFIGDDGQAYAMVWNGRGKPTDPKNFEAVPVTTNAALRYDEWRQLDEAVVAVGQQRLVGFDDLRRNGLTFSLPNAMGKTVLTYQKISEAMEANVDISPLKRGTGDTVDYSTAHIPIPVIFADYDIEERLLAESRNIGTALDVTNAEAAARKVAEKLEDMLFGSTSILTYGGGTIYTYLTEPNINTVSFNSAGDYWDASGKTAAEIFTDVENMKAALHADYHYGPYMLYVPTDYEKVLDRDYSVSGASLKTIRQRILEMGSIQDIKVVDRLADDTVIMVQMTRDVVDVIDGMPMQNMEWSSEGGLVHHYKVMTIQIPRVKSDYNSRSGVCVLS